MGWDIGQVREYYSVAEHAWKSLETFQYISRPTFCRPTRVGLNIEGIVNGAELPFNYCTRFYGLFAMLNHVRCEHLNVPLEKVFDPTFRGLPFDVSRDSAYYLKEVECHGFEKYTSYATLHELHEYLERTRDFWTDMGYYTNRIGERESIRVIDFFEEWLRMHNAYRLEMSERFSEELDYEYEILSHEYRIIWTYNF